MFPVQSADGWKLLLNDFGSAIPYSGKIVARRMSCQHELHLHFCIPALAPGPPKLFGGCLEHAHDDVLDGYASEPPVAVLYTPRFDLEMVVRCVYHWMHPATYSFIGSHKRCTDKDFTAEAKGQLLNYLQTMIDIQFRHKINGEDDTVASALGYLTDGLKIQFFKLTRKANGVFSDQHTRAFSIYDPSEKWFGEGGHILLRLLQTQDLSSLGYHLPSIDCEDYDVSITELLGGDGRFSMVYAATVTHVKASAVPPDCAVTATPPSAPIGTHVVKVFRCVGKFTAKQLCAQEKQNLEAVANFPVDKAYLFRKVVAVGKHGRSLVQYPKGLKNFPLMSTNTKRQSSI